MVNEASKVLTFQHEDEFLKDLYDVGLSIEKCCHKLYELNLLHCDEFNSASDGKALCWKFSTVELVILLSYWTFF